MKKSLSSLFSAVLLFVSVQNSQAAANAAYTINISSYNGGSQSLIDWSFTGAFTNGVTSSSWITGFVGFSITGTNMWNGTISSPTNPVSGAGVFNVLSGTVPSGHLSSAQIQSVQFDEYGSFGPYQAVNLKFTNSGIKFFGGPNNTFNYTPGIDSYVLPIAYSSFNEGVYTSITQSSLTPSPDANGLTENYLATVNIGTVPEPSTYALLLLSGAASLWALKRRKR